MVAALQVMIAAREDLGATSEMEIIKLLNWIHSTDHSLQDKPKSILSLGPAEDPESDKYLLVDKSTQAKQELKFESLYHFP